ncbi:MAG: Trehalose/maltose import ATP-binding protein MalK [Methanosaeta sp. PtaU1.Bin060]|nr:MAG: Trehalose/maltose import ATP-binding protein MalK [Methanosaeta sp. PtaU1.Bin060]
MTYAVEVEDLSYSYPNGTTALRDVSFQLDEGGSLALLGPNGAGKSTLMLHLNGLIAGTGSVRILGQLVRKESLQSIRRNVGMLFQDPDDQLIMPSLWEDVAFGPRNLGQPEDEVERNVAWALQAVGLADHIDSSPQSLSFGQKKKAALATALSMRPKILVLDEPTSNLDPRSKRDVVKLLNQLQRSNVTTILSTHDVNLVPLLAEDVLLLNQEVIARGKTRKIMGERELLEEQGLEMPLFADLFEELREEGRYNGPTPFTKSEAKDALESIIK